MEERSIYVPVPERCNEKKNKMGVAVAMHFLVWGSWGRHYTTYDGGGSISCTLHLLYYGIFARAMRTYRKLILSLVPRGLNIGT